MKIILVALPQFLPRENDPNITFCFLSSWKTFVEFSNINTFCFDGIAKNMKGGIRHEREKKAQNCHSAACGIN